jgi:hypothetical protein
MMSKTADFVLLYTLPPGKSMHISESRQAIYGKSRGAEKGNVGATGRYRVLKGAARRYSSSGIWKKRYAVLSVQA